MKKMMILIAFAAFGALPATAQTVVNGKLLNAQEVAWLAQFSCGPVWPGNYWLNTVTGQWGFAGNPIPMGHIRDRCGATQRRPSLSERGMLFRPGEILNGR